MPRYQVTPSGRGYTPRVEHNQQAWNAILRLMRPAGSAEEADLRQACSACRTPDGRPNGGYFGFAVRNGWIAPVPLTLSSRTTLWCLNTSPTLVRACRQAADGGAPVLRNKRICTDPLKIEHQLTVLRRLCPHRAKHYWANFWRTPRFSVYLLLRRAFRRHARAHRALSSHRILNIVDVSAKF